MVNIKNNIKRVGFKLGIAAMTILPAKTSAQTFVYNSAHMQMEVATDMIKQGALIENKSSRSKPIVFYGNARMVTKKYKNKKTGTVQQKRTIVRDLISLDSTKNPTARKTPNGNMYEILRGTMTKRNDTSYVYNTDKLYTKYAKILYKHFPHLRNQVYENTMNINVTFSGPFELIEAIDQGEMLACVCRNGYEDKTLCASREYAISMFMDPEKDLYIIRDKEQDSTYKFTARMKTASMSVPAPRTR